MSAAVQPSSDRSAAAFGLSVLLHGSLLLLPLLGVFAREAPGPAPSELPNSVAMLGNSIEVEAPTEELQPAPAKPQPADGPARSEPVDVGSLPVEPAAEPLPRPEPRTPASTAPARKPRPREEPATKPRASAANSSEVAAAEASSRGAPAAGTFGQEGLAPGVRRLGYAFTRAIPAATPGDDEWQQLPPGKVGTIRIELEVDENNRLGALREWQARPGEPAPPPILRRMVQRTLLLLRAGQFALSGSNQAGTERLVIEVQTSDQAAEGEGQREVVQKKFDGASPGRPGTAYFRYGNGRVVEAKVTIVPAGPR